MIVFSQPPAHWEFLDVPFKDWLHHCAAHWEARIGEMQYLFLSNAEIKAANGRFLGHDYVTDIITFSYAQGKRVMAECLIGYERVDEQARERKLALEEEAGRVMVHGLLHCLGFDDQTPDQKRAMRAAEDYCLLLRAKNL
ncbi:MAG: rRNA maturation RNase YbeY [Schleiferiaceae bacterium]|nr:rRNA maturation RNase YbeY [Schleiferiaceae bacterium]